MTVTTKRFALAVIFCWAGVIAPAFGQVDFKVGSHLDLELLDTKQDKQQSQLAIKQGPSIIKTSKSEIQIRFPETADPPAAPQPTAPSTVRLTPTYKHGTPPPHPVPAMPVPAVAAPIAATPIAAAPIAATPIAATPIAATPIAATPIAATPIAATPIAATPIAATPIAATPIAATPYASTPIPATPYASTLIPSTPIASTVVPPAVARPAVVVPAVATPAVATPAVITPVVALEAPVTQPQLPVVTRPSIQTLPPQPTGDAKAFAAAVQSIVQRKQVPTALAPSTPINRQPLVPNESSLTNRVPASGVQRVRAVAPPLAALTANTAPTKRSIDVISATDLENSSPLPPPDLANRIAQLPSTSAAPSAIVASSGTSPKNEIGTVVHPENLSQATKPTDGQVLPTGLSDVFCGSCGDASCGGCSNCIVGAECGDCCSASSCVPTYWVGGVEATFLEPDLNRGDVSYRVQDQFAVAPVDVSFGSGDIAVDDFYAAPRFWIGVQHGKWGVVGRYWHLQAAEHAFDPFSFSPPGPAADVGFFLNNRFEAYTTDLEATRSFSFHDTRNTLSFGARYGSLTHDTSLSADAQILDSAGGNLAVISGNARANRRAFGTGITGSFSGRKPLFSNSCIHLYYGLRGSVLWGTISNSAETDSFESTAGAAAGSFNNAAVSVSDSFFIGEAQLGLQWDYRVACFPADAFFRIGAEYQYWDATTGTASATSFAGFGAPNTPPFSQGQAFADTDGLSLDLIGISVSTGFNW